MQPTNRIPKRLSRSKRQQLMLEPLEDRAQPAHLTLVSPDENSPPQRSGPFDQFSYSNQWQGVQYNASAYDNPAVVGSRQSKAVIRFSDSMLFRIDPDNGEPLGKLVGIHISSWGNFYGYALKKGYTHSLAATVKYVEDGKARAEDLFPIEHRRVESDPLSVTYDANYQTGFNARIGTTFRLIGKASFIARPDIGSGISSGWGVAGQEGSFISSVSIDQTVQMQIGAPASDVKVLDATTDDLVGRQSTKLSYEVDHMAAPGPMTVSAYLSADSVVDGGDELLGEIYLNDSSLLTKGKHENIEVTSPHPIDVKGDRRFVLIELFAGNEFNWSNNETFIIPLIQPDKAGGVLISTGSFAYGTPQEVPETSCSGEIQGRISAGTTDFLSLLNKNHKGSWETVASGTFRNEEKAPYKDDDLYLNNALGEKFDTFAALLQQAKDEKRLKTSRLEITEAFDEEGEHSNNALHYEGRAIDIAANSAEARMRIAGLGLLAGFDWAYNEAKPVHVHLSAQGSHATITADSIMQALDNFGPTAPQPLVNDQILYAMLRQHMATVASILNGPPPDDQQMENVRTELEAFLDDIKNNHQGLKQGFQYLTKPTEIEVPFPLPVKPTYGFLFDSATRLLQQLGL